MQHLINTRVVTVPGLEQQRLGIDTAQGDPNSTEAHTDTIKTALLFKIESVLATPEEKDAARALFKQLYPKES